MKFVKPYGRSVTNQNPNAKKRTLKLNNPPSMLVAEVEFQEFNKSNAKILIGQWISILDKIIKKPSAHEKLTDLAGVQNAFDQPDENGGARKAQLQARAEIGKHCWELLTPYFKDCQHDDLKKLEQIWKQKLHPYGQHFAVFKNYRFKRDESGELILIREKPIEDENFKLENEIPGRWFERFAGDSNIFNLDYNDVAKSIHEHLHSNEYLISKNARNRSGKRGNSGLIDTRAKSITDNSLATRMRRRLVESLEQPADIQSLKSAALNQEFRQWGEKETQTFKKNAGDVAEKIYNLSVDAETRDERITYQDAAKCIFEHYGILLRKNDGTVASRSEIGPGLQPLLCLYDDIKLFYKKAIKNSRKGRRKPKLKQSIKGERNTNLSVTLPKNHNALIKKLECRDVNAVTNDLIRLGRVLHYQRTPNDEDTFGYSQASPIWDGNIIDIAQSHYWSSEGQAEIKRTEAFVRVWRNTMVQAARTAKSFSGVIDQKDSEGRPADPLLKNISAKLAKQTDCQEIASRHAHLLFGKHAKLFLNPKVNSDSLVFGTLRAIAKLRNESFHFKGRKVFITNFKKSFENAEGIMTLEDASPPKAFISSMKEFLVLEHKAQRVRVIEVLESACINLFANELELEDFVKLVIDPAKAEMALPNFNGLLERAKNTDQCQISNSMGQLPLPASQVELKDDASRAKYVCLKRLYETDFKNWIQTDLTSEKLASYAENAIDRGTLEAKRLNGDGMYEELLEARTTNLPRPKQDQSLPHYLDDMQAFQNSEMRIQNGYENDSVAAKKKSKWVENFKRDILVNAFSDYLGQLDTKVKWLTLLKPNTTPRIAIPMPSVETLLKNFASQQWLAIVYYVLHFVPIDDVSRLLHQFIKWGVLENASTPDSNVEDLREVLILYLDMKDDKHSGVGIETIGLDQIKDRFFDSENDFNKAFVTQDSNDDQLGSTRRNLREILRFGNLKVLSAAAGISKVSSANITNLNNLEKVESGQKHSSIAKAQLKRKKLHQLFSEDKSNEEKKTENEKKNNYIKKIAIKLMNPGDSEKKATQDTKDKYDNWKLEKETENFKIYAQCLVIIRQHRKLAAKVRLTEIIKLNQLLTRISSRLVDFAGLWERDRYFISLAILALSEKAPNDVFKNGANTFAKSGQLPKKIEDIDESFFKILNVFHTSNLSDIRNNIDHFEFLADDDVNLTRVVNDTRALLSYDRKLKNAVTKALLDLILQEGIELVWDMGSDHKLKFNSLKSRTMIHLSKNRRWKAFKALEDNEMDKFKEPFHEESFEEMASQLFKPNSTEQ